MTDATLAFIGAGNMAGAIINGLISDGYAPERIIACDPDPEKLHALRERCGIRTEGDNADAVAAADLLVLAVKPQVLAAVCVPLAPAVQKRRPLVLSIAAGVRESALQGWLGGDVAVVRSMPNTPAMIGAGASVLHAGEGVSDHQRDLAESVMRATGLTRWVEDEALMDAVTAVSGSGPAYFFLVMEAMEQAAKNLGLPDDTAHLLTLQTALGAARMAMESSDDPATLRARVTSPGGTTEAALRSFEDDGLRQMFERALTAARDRSVELSAMVTNDDG